MSIKTDAAALESAARISADRNQSPAKLRDACRQFEAILVRMILKEAHLERSLVHSDDRANLYGDLLIESLAKSVVDGGGMGIAEILYQQLSQNLAESNPTPPDGRIHEKDEKTFSGGE